MMQSLCRALLGTGSKLPGFNATLACLLTGLALAGCAPTPEISEHAEIIFGQETLGPATTVELRLEEPITQPGLIGIPLTNSPLVIKPAVPGTFTWITPRSGRFVPSEAFAMDTRYEMTLAEGLTNAAGQPVRAKLQKTLRTPPFSIVGSLPLQPSTNSTSEPEIKLVFNLNVDPVDANRFMDFRDSRGRRIAARVRNGTTGDRPASYEFGRYVPMETWAGQFELAQPWSSELVEIEDPFETNVVPNLLVVVPSEPLPVGKEWRLVVGRGLPSADSRMRLPKAQEVQVGNVAPFVFNGGSTENVLNSPPAISLQFSKPLALSLTNEWPKFVSIEPAPDDLEMTLLWNTMVFRGNFKSESRCQVTLQAGLPSAESFKLASNSVVDAWIEKVSPRLYFPAFSKDQMAHGLRRFPLLAINVPGIRLRAKLLEPETALFALRGYESYFRTWDDRHSFDEQFHRLDYNLVPGRTVFDQEIPVAAALDVSTNLDLSWDQVLSGRKCAVVFVEAERTRNEYSNDPRLGTQALIQLTDLGVVWKRCRSEVQATVFSYASGKPVPGATVSVLTGENEKIGEAITGSEGNALVPASTNAQWLAVRFGEDFHALELNEHEVSTYRFNLPGDSFSSDSERRVMLFADRELYRPGETLQLCALVRDCTDSGLAVPAHLEGTLVCRDARDRKFFETNVTFSAFGSCTVSVPLDASSRGGYRAVLRLGENQYFYAFQVADFQPSAFEISLPAKSSYIAGEKISVPVSANYFFGKPVNHAEVGWTIQASGTGFNPKSFEGYLFSRSYDDPSVRIPASVTLNGAGKLAGATNLVIEPELPVNPIALGPRMVSLQVEVTDINQQTLNKRVEFIQHSSDFYIGIRSTEEVQTAGKELPLDLVTVGADGKPWQQPVEVRVSLHKIEWQPVRIMGAGRAMRFRNQKTLTNVVERSMRIDPVKLPAQGQDSVSGTVLRGIVPPQAGQYLIEASTLDSAGRKVISTMEFAVTAEEALAWNYRDDYQLTLKPDRKTYVPGDKAVILLEAPISGTALVTIERENVMRSFTTNLTGNAPAITIPIEKSDVPNVVVSVALLRGAEACPRDIKEPEYRIGFCPLKVEDPQNRLAVEVTTTRTNYLPAQEVQVTAIIKDSTGATLGNAEVILYAIDEGVLSLSGASLPDPYSFFFAPRGLRVRTSISLPNLLQEDAELLEFGNKGYLGGDGDTAQIRQKFLACAFWKANLRTDPDGRVQAKFPAPDSLTGYRLVAVAHTTQSQFGVGSANFQVSKPLMVEPALPQFANVTDRLLARAVVMNQTPREEDVEVTLQLDGLAKLATNGPGLTRLVRVKPYDSTAVEFPVELVDAGSSQWIWRARFANDQAGFTDAVQSTLAVGYPSPEMRQITYTRIQNLETDLLTGSDPELVSGSGTVTVQVANTRLINLTEAISGLLQYPYGCAEQTASSLLPWISLHGMPQWSALATGATNDPQRAIKSGISRLLSMQTQSGGLGYWPGDQKPMFYVSAYGGMVLSLARRQGFEVPQESLNDLMNYLSARLRSDNGKELRDEDLCLAAYSLALAGRPEPAYHERMFNIRSALTGEGRALLALAIVESNGSREMIDTLLTAKTASAEPNEDAFGSVSRTRAVRLLASICANPEAPETDALVAGLIQEQQGGHWVTTQANAWAILALSEYSRKVEKPSGVSAGVLEWNQEKTPFRLDATNGVFSRTFALKAGTKPPALKVSPSQGTIYASTVLAARPSLILQPRKDQGFGIARKYERLNDDNTTATPDTFRVGDRVLVTLNLEVRRPAMFVAIDDPLPANFEAINPGFKGQNNEDSVQGLVSPAGLDLNWFTDFREIRADRMLFFANRLPAGNYTMRYVARVRTGGTATAASTRVEEMYHPDRHGLAAAQVVVSKSMD